MDKLRVVDADIKNRCANLDGHAIQEALHILLYNAQLILNKTKEDHRYAQGNLHALELVRDLMKKP